MEGKEVILRELGVRIKDLRTKKGISQKELAYSINKDQQSIQRLEKGKINPSFYYLYEISKGLNVSLNEIFSMP